MYQMYQSLLNFISFISLTSLAWFLLISLGWLLNQIYSIVTCRTKIIQIKSIHQGLGLKSECILVDSELLHYYILSNHILGVNNLEYKISHLKLNSDYEIKIYGFNSFFTKIRLIDIKPC